MPIGISYQMGSDLEVSRGFIDLDVCRDCAQDPWPQRWVSAYRYPPPGKEDLR